MFVGHTIESIRRELMRMNISQITNLKETSSVNETLSEALKRPETTDNIELLDSNLEVLLAIYRDEEEPYKSAALLLLREICLPDFTEEEIESRNIMSTLVQKISTPVEPTFN